MSNSNKTKTEKQWGGHQTGFRADISSGSGPVFEIRKGLKLSQAALAKKIGCGESTVRRNESAGTWPESRAVQSLLRGLADEAGLDLSE